MSQFIKGFVLLLLFCSQSLYPQSTKTSSLGLYCGPGFSATSGNLKEYFKFDLGGTMSLNYSHKKMNYYLSISGKGAKLKHDIPLNDGNVWEEGNKASFFSYGLSAGYSIYQG